MRKTGYYWVCTKRSEGWHRCWYDSKRKEWHLLRDIKKGMEAVTDSAFFEINETRILNPDEHDRNI